MRMRSALMPSDLSCERWVYVALVQHQPLADEGVVPRHGEFIHARRARVLEEPRDLSRARNPDRIAMAVQSAKVLPVSPVDVRQSRLREVGLTFCAVPSRAEEEHLRGRRAGFQRVVDQDRRYVEHPPAVERRSIECSLPNCLPLVPRRWHRRLSAAHSSGLDRVAEEKENRAERPAKAGAEVGALQLGGGHHAVQGEAGRLKARSFSPVSWQIFRDLPWSSTTGELQANREA